MRASIVAILLSFSLISGSVAHADELGDLADAIDKTPDEAKVYDAYAVAAFKTRRFDDAIKKLKVGVARVPGYSEGYYKLAYAFRQKKEWADAADYYRRYIEIMPRKTDPYFGLGAALTGLGDRKGAISAYEKYVELEKAPEKARFVDAARAELIKLDPSRAPAKPPEPVKIAEPTKPEPVKVEPVKVELIKPDPPRVDVAKLRSNAHELFQAQRYEDAIVAFNKAIEADPTNAELRNDLGSCHFKLKHFADAAGAFRAATERDPKLSLAWYNLGQASRKADKKADAVAAFRAYLKLRPDDPDPYYSLGQTLKSLGDVPGAIDAFRKYVSMEKRTEFQAFVDKARAELEALEQLQKSGRRLPAEEHLFDEDRLLDPFNSEPQVVAIRDPEIRDPFTTVRDLRDPFTERVGLSIADRLAPVSLPPSAALREYSQALEAYRRALNRQTESVSLGYQRGVEESLAQRPAAAVRAWNNVVLEDAQLSAARRGVERVRTLLSRR